MFKKIKSIGLALVLIMAVVPSMIKADDISDLKQEDQDRFREVAGMLRCPTCTGLSVLGSDAQFSVQIKNIVKDQVLKGKPKDEILEYFTTRYGPWILREPPKSGFNMVAWAFPIALLLLGPALIWFFVWRRVKQAPVGGMRSTESIVEEFERAVATLRQKEGHS